MPEFLTAVLGQEFYQYLLIGLVTGLLYALIALGYTLVYGIIELINFAHGDLFMLGTIFTGFVLTTVLKQSTQSLSGWVGLIVTLLCVMAACATINVVIEFLAYRR